MTSAELKFEEGAAVRGELCAPVAHVRFTAPDNSKL